MLHPGRDNSLGLPQSAYLPTPTLGTLRELWNPTRGARGQAPRNQLEACLLGPPTQLRLATQARTSSGGPVLTF